MSPAAMRTAVALAGAAVIFVVLAAPWYIWTLWAIIAVVSTGAHLRYALRTA
ncbi:hypothetical protein [Gordonia aichiensis]|uniref:hypothetical protein n=1 Tax=Gordonia aichiensis TaxID=36820 RepID=UPI003266D5A0